MDIDEFHERMIAPTRLVGSLEEQAESFGLGDAVRAIGLGTPRAAQLVRQQQLRYGTCGLAEETGEIARIVKHHIDYGRPLERGSLTLELGDALFFVGFLARVNGVSLEDVARSQLSKIQRRFGDRWDPGKALAKRDGDE